MPSLHHRQDKTRLFCSVKTVFSCPCQRCERNFLLSRPIFQFATRTCLQTLQTGLDKTVQSAIHVYSELLNTVLTCRHFCSHHHKTWQVWLDLAGGRPAAQLKLGLTETMFNNVRQLSRRLVGIYYKQEIKLKWFSGRSRLPAHPKSGSKNKTCMSCPSWWCVQV